jgi:hypothetical protein
VETWWAGADEHTREAREAGVERREMTELMPVRERPYFLRLALVPAAAYVGGIVGLLASGDANLAACDPQVVFGYLVMAVGPPPALTALVMSLIVAVVFVARKWPLWTSGVLVPCFAVVTYLCRIGWQS